MNQKKFSLIGGAVFLLIAVLHLLRIVSSWEVLVAGVSIPLWVSWIGVVVAGYLGYAGIKQSRP